MENAQIAQVFDKIADLVEISGGNEFRVRSYRNAARTVRDQPERIEDIVNSDGVLEELPGIGESIANQIKEILETGSSTRLREMQAEIPPGLTEVMKIPGLGAKKAKFLYDQLEVDSLEDLKKAAEKHKIRELEGMGEKTEQMILKGLETVNRESGRLLLIDALNQADSISRHLDRIDAVSRWEIAGSLRRWKETIGDLDILVHAQNRKRAVEKILDYEEIGEVVGRGEEKVTIRTESGVQVDFRFFEPKSFGSALLYFTGSKAHNIALRRIAQDKDWKLNEYGLFSGKKRLAGKTEESMYSRLKMHFVPPELRENRGEIEASQEGRLPTLVELKDIKGDLHVHTNETDGRNTLEEMVRAARDFGRKYLAITNHSKAVTVAKGMDEDRLKKHAEKVRSYDSETKDIWILTGVEVDILKSGELDLDEKVLDEMDWVSASVHSYFDLKEKKMTERIVRAVESGVIDALSHPFGRQISKREPISFDVDKVFEACRDNNVYLEINCYPDRLDLPDNYCKRAAETGANIVINTDAHKTTDLDFMKYGVAVARRGWLGRKNILNTVSASTLKKRIGRK